MRPGVFHSLTHTGFLKEGSLAQAYIDFEISEGERGNTRQLYERLLDRTQHVKVWLSYASFEAKPMPVPQDEEENGDVAVVQQQTGDEAPTAREAAARRSFTYLFSCMISYE